MNNIIIKDNLFDSQEKENIYSFCKNSSFKRLERDHENLPHTGLTSELNLDHPLVKLIINKSNERIINLQRAYINLFLKEEKPYFHTDNHETGYKTLLYYVNTEPKNYDELGETFFLVDNEVKGIQPVPGRIVIFDAEILHRASSLRNYDRFTIALKWRT